MNAYPRHSCSRSPRAVARRVRTGLARQAGPLPRVRARRQLARRARPHIGDKLKDKLGQPVVVENKPAAGGTVAIGEVAKAAPATATRCCSAFNGPLSIAPLLQKLPYDVAKDLAPVIITTSQPNVLAVNAQLPVEERAGARRVGESQSRASSITRRSATAARRTSTAELLKSLAGIDAVHVPFNGSPPAVTVDGAGRDADDLRGDAAAAAADPGRQAARARRDDGRSAFRCCPTSRRSPSRGYPGFEALAWNGVMVPAATPKPIIARLNAEIERDPQAARRRAEAATPSGFDLDRRNARADFARLHQERDRDKLGAGRSRSSASRSTRRLVLRGCYERHVGGLLRFGSPSASRGSGESPEDCSSPSSM